MNKITALIFSKNRAMQLHALLESFAENCPNMFEPYIVYKATHKDFEEGYEHTRLSNILPNISWILEFQLSPKEYFLRAVSHSENQDQKLISLFTDDCIFYRKCRLSDPWQIHNFMKNNPQIITFSFRLGKNTIVQNYSTGQTQPKLSSVPYNVHINSFNDKILTWNYKLFNSQLNYGYPFSYDGHVYLLNDFKEIINKFERLDYLRDWEGCLSNPDNRAWITKNKMCAAEESYVVNIPLNTTQWPPIPFTSQQYISTEELNTRYLDGVRIDWGSMDFSNVVGCHQEIKYEFK